jgi:hypothetical protein
LSSKPDSVRSRSATHAKIILVSCWAAQFGAARRWTVEDCPHLSRRLERDLRIRQKNASSGAAES